jgi:predicted nuclease of predicted toxin-antitoxin system
VAKFLLDENLSPRISKHLEKRLGLDVVPLRELGRTGIKDPGVLDLAIRHRRVLITRDSDFVDAIEIHSFVPPGILWLHPSELFRSNEAFKKVLERFFASEAGGFDLERSVIEVTEQSSTLLFARQASP